MLTFDIAGAQIDGARDYQEDAFMVTRIGDLSAEVGATLAIVADGMGGHAAGNVASNMAVQSFNKHLAVHYATNPLPTVLREAVKQANQSITETVRETAALKGMGCTLVAAVIDAEQLYWASVGDSHLYLLRGTELKKQNADHSYGGFLTRMAAQGRQIEPEAGFSRNMLMSALTGDEIADIDCPESPLTLLTGDRIVIASDGLDTLSTGKLASLLGASSTAKAGVEALLNAVQEAKMPRQDNTTVIVLMVGEKAEFKPRPTTPLRLQEPPGQRLSQPRAQVPLEVTPAPRSGHPWLVLAAALLLTLGGGASWFFGGAPETARIAVLPPVPETSPAALPTPAAPVPTVAEPATSATPTPAAPDPAASAAPVPPTAAIENFVDAMAGGHGPTLVWVPAGEFQMGAPDSAAGFDERPQHNVKLGRFAISTQEVSVAEYAKFTAATGHKPPRDSARRGAKMPVTFVSWNDALAYVRWLSTQTGKRYRLPSEAEWEYVARAGTSTPYWWGRGVGENRAHCFDCETGLNPRQPTTVGRFKPNPWGVFDTAGNVNEWVNDCYHPDYTSAPSDGSVFEGGDCGYRVIRGGAFSSTAKSLRVTARGKLTAASANDTVGIRVVREP
jgi:formylglycine-generating enzyme required for sulfatase activity/serine/threonine protein phosphatase PrpC